MKVEASDIHILELKVMTNLVEYDGLDLKEIADELTHFSENISTVLKRRYG